MLAQLQAMQLQQVRLIKGTNIWGTHVAIAKKQPQMWQMAYKPQNDLKSYENHNLSLWEI